MQADIEPILQIIPFDQKYAVRADIMIEKQSQRMFVMKTFLMFVLEVKSSMDEAAIRSLKGFILETCVQLLERNGIDNIGFVINKNYHTIRNPNYEGIKDLLNAHVKVDDSRDIRDTLICLRNSIHLEAKKLQQSKISIVMFTSNVAEDPLTPVKRTYRMKMNSYISNYQKQIERLNNTIQKMCDDCYFYSIAYMRKYGNDKQQQFGWVGCAQFDQEGIDTLLLYKLSSICKKKQFSYNVCHSYTQLCDKFNEVSAVMLYEFHQFSVMVPVRDTKKTTFTPDTNVKQREVIMIDEQKQKEQNQMQEQIEDINDEQLEEYFKNNKQQMNQEIKEEKEVEEEVEYQPLFEVSEGVKYVKLDLTNTDETKFTIQGYTYFKNTELDLKQIHDKGYHIFRKVEKKKELEFPDKKKVIKRLAMLYKPEYVSKNVNYHEPNTIELIKCQSQYYKQELSDIIFQIREKILKYKKRLVGTYKQTKIYQAYVEVDELVQSQLKTRLYKIEQIVREMYEKVFKDELIKAEKVKRSMFELYSGLKSMIDTTNQVFMNIFKKQIKNEDIGKLSAAVNYDKIKSSLKRKLIKRVNSNPKMIDDVYDKVQQVCSKQIVNFIDIEAKYRQEKSEVGNCMYTFKNFATSLRDRDCLALVFEIERPNAAIADPGRIRIRQVSTLVVGVSKFFQTHQYFIQTDYEKTLQKCSKQFKQSKTKLIQKSQDPSGQYCPFCKCICIFDYVIDLIDYKRKQYEIPKEFSEILQKRKQTNYGINRNQYKENWDYWNRVESKDTFFGIMPLYVCEENWKVAKHLMKPCMGWTACGEPLGYTYSQTQTIPFMVLSALIRAVQQSTYKIAQLVQQSRKCLKESQRNGLLYQANLIKHKKARHEQLLRQTQKTCEAIMRDMSGPNIEQPLSKAVIDKYLSYEKPICRTVDMISNNSSFISQLYTVIKLGIFEKPKESEFHEFFKRFIEEELRRETDGWNQEEVQQKFINKLLNTQIQKMDKPQYMVMESEYLDRFEKALQGELIRRTEFQIQREALEMVIKQNNKFNDTQRMSIIQYKRLYENRVLYLWYIRFRLYEEKERVSIHKWKCLDLTNSYQLFTLIIQNKKQRKNWKRREAILQGDYVDPFDYYKARQYLQHEFVKMRNKKQSQNIILLHAEKYGRASQVFAMTRDMREAAGALMNIEVGREVTIYFHQLYKQSNFIEQKLRMLLLAEYQGVPLFKHGWKMSKKRMAMLRKRYPFEFQKYQYMF